MPLKINVGLSKKMGLPDYGSVGASCNVEAEVDESLDDLEHFQQRVRRAYVACAQAVADELARHMKGNPPPRPPTEDGRSSGNRPSNNGRGQRNGSRNEASASGKQFNYIRRLAGFIKGLGVRKLDNLTLRMFDKPLAGLSSFEASSLIDTLKSVNAGDVELDEVLQGEAA